MMYSVSYPYTSEDFPASPKQKAILNKLRVKNSKSVLPFDIDITSSQAKKAMNILLSKRDTKISVLPLDKFL